MCLMAMLDVGVKKGVSVANHVSCFILESRMSLVPGDSEEAEGRPTSQHDLRFSQFLQVRV